MDLVEGVGESSSPPWSFGSYSSGCYGIRNDVHHRLLECGHQDALSNPFFRQLLDAHFNRFPSSYLLDINMNRVDDVVLHQRLLALAKHPENRPVFHVRFLENLSARADGNDDQHSYVSTSKPYCNEDNEGVVPSPDRSRNCEIEFEPWSLTTKIWMLERILVTWRGKLLQ